MRRTAGTVRVRNQVMATLVLDLALDLALALTLTLIGESEKSSYGTFKFTRINVRQVQV